MPPGTPRPSLVRRDRSLRQLSVLASVVGLVAASLVVVLLTVLDNGTPRLGSPDGVPSAAAGLPVPLGQPGLLAPLAGSDGPAPTRDGLAQAISSATFGLGGSVGVAVVDGASGKLLYGQDSDLGRVPASTTKLLTAAAALSVLGPEARLETKVVTGASADEIILVGGGDPTLTSGQPPPDGYPTPASLTTLARRTAGALKQRGTASVRLAYDDDMFSGPELAAGWTSGYLTPGRAVVGRVSALAVDAGRIRPPEAETRSRTPAEQAARQFADLLEDRGIDVVGLPDRVDAPADTRQLSSVASPPVSALVERMLTTSDNDLAEALARQVAVKQGKPGTFTGGADAVSSAVGKLGIEIAGLDLNDGSGLSHSNRIPPRMLTDVLVAAGRRAALRAILTGLPVAGFSGTLGDRSVDGADSGGEDSAGLVRAKTGTLNGVSALAGVVIDEDGRQLVFAVLADQVASHDSAERALDRIAADLASCGCR